MALQEGKTKTLHAVGNYRLSGKLLGKGNFARVEEAVHTILNVKVAIKIINISQIKEDYVIKNLFREAKLMAKLNHPCICALYQTMQQSQSVYYLVTELASGGDLSTFVKDQRNGRLEERLVRIFARQFVSALAYMHYVGVVHRDLKMENVVLNASRTQIKIVDFGLSNFYKPNEHLKTHCGSPEYAAPELFVTGMKYGPEVDLWSLGIILYGMIVGQLPFVSSRNEQVSSQDQKKQLVAQINKGLVATHRKALSISSSTFQNMIGQMLVPNVIKRITIKELVLHPFITERGTKLIRINPMKKLDIQEQANIVAEICDLTRQPSEQVIKLIRQEPFSKIGGMYNILTHRYSLKLLSKDGVTKSQPILATDKEKAKSGQTSPTKRTYNLRNVSTNVPDSSGDKYSPKIKVQTKKLSPQQERKPPITAQSLTRPKTEGTRPGTPLTGTRPRTVLPRTNDKKISYRDLKASAMARKTFSADVGSKTNRPSTVSSPISYKSSSIMNTKIPKEIIKRLYPDQAINKKTPSAYLDSLKLAMKPEKDSSKNFNDHINKIQTVLDQRKRSKSEKLTSARPLTTPPRSIREKVAISKSDSKATNKQMTTSPTGFERSTRLLKSNRPATTGPPIEKLSVVYGNLVNRNQALYQKVKKPPIYDPIARSIAGYVYNNVPNTLPRFKK